MKEIVVDGSTTLEQDLARRAWRGRIAAERSYRYYLDASRRHRQRYVFISVGIMFLTAIVMGVSAFNLAATPSVWLEWVRVVAAGGIAFLVSLLMGLNDARTVAKAESASEYFAMLGRDWRYIWQHRDPAEDEANIRLLEERMHSAPDVGIDIKAKINRRCQREAIDVVKADYGYAPAAA